MGEMREKGRSGVRVLDEQLSLPFDQHQRYRMVADAIERLREGSDPLRILDVGEGMILNFLPEDQITVLDRSDSKEASGFVRGDATALPFEDESFDYVASVDVYEHIEPTSRERHLSELRRVARKGVLLAAPFDSDVVRGAERVANEFHRSVHLRENVWLREHAENGLPRLDGTRKFYEAHGDMVSVLPNGYLPHWLAMICLTFYSSKFEGGSGGIFDRVNAFYNEYMYGLDNTEPSYRYLLVALREPVNANLDALMSSEPAPERASQSFALFGILSAMFPANAQLAQKEGALARKEAQVNDLSRRLAERVSTGHTYRVQAERRMNRLQQDYGNLERQRNELQRQLSEVANSRVWRLLTVLRKLGLAPGRIFRSG
jgi:hypothetical protein